MTRSDLLVACIIICCTAIIFCKKSFQLIILLCFFLMGGWRFTANDNSCEESAEFFQNQMKKQLSGKALVIGYEHLIGKRYPIALTMKIISLKHHSVPPRSTIIIYLLKQTRLLPGDEIEFKGLVCPKRSNHSYERYLFKEGIVASIYSDSLQYKKIHCYSYSTRRLIFQKREKIRSALVKKLSSNTGSLFSTLFLGEKVSGRSQELHKYFSYWGIVHFLARSGLHVMVLVTMWRRFLMLLRVPWAISQSILLFMLTIYYLLSWPSISFVRARISWYQGLVLLGKSPSTLHILSITTLLVLLYNPYQLFFLDFQLSFGLTCALAWWQETRYQHMLKLRLHALARTPS